MADYTNLNPVSVDDPGTAEWANAVAENPIAMFEGAAGAPRLQDAALSGSVTGTGVNWVAARIVNNAWNGVGQTVMAYIDGTTLLGPVGGRGFIISGANLSSCDADRGRGSVVAESRLPGTWRCQGWAYADQSVTSAPTDWLRVS